MRVSIIVRSLIMSVSSDRSTSMCAHSSAVWSVCQNWSSENELLNSAIELITHLLMFVIKNALLQS